MEKENETNPDLKSERSWSEVEAGKEVEAEAGPTAAEQVFEHRTVKPSLDVWTSRVFSYLVAAKDHEIAK